MPWRLKRKEGSPKERERERAEQIVSGALIFSNQKPAIEIYTSPSVGLAREIATNQIRICSLASQFLSLSPFEFRKDREQGLCFAFAASPLTFNALFLRRKLDLAKISLRPKRTVRRLLSLFGSNKPTDRPTEDDLCSGKTERTIGQFGLHFPIRQPSLIWPSSRPAIACGAALERPSAIGHRSGGECCHVRSVCAALCSRAKGSVSSSLSFEFSDRERERPIEPSPSHSLLALLALLALFTDRDLVGRDQRLKWPFWRDFWALFWAGLWAAQILERN